MGSPETPPQPAAPEPSRLDQYDTNNQSPHLLIALGTLVLLALVWGVLAFLEGSWLKILTSTDWVAAHSTRWLYERHIFIIYSCAFVAWWVVYFGSRKPDVAARDKPFKRVKSLRRLLGECSVQWRCAEQTEKLVDEIESGYREKAKSSMTTIAIMIAVSALELQEVSKLLATLLEGQESVALTWQVMVLVLSLAFAMVAFIAYIVSADALDVIFNRFVDNDARHRITRYYYQRTINPRYAALISLIASFILLVAYYSPVAAAVAIGLFFVIGYAHWFPDFRTKHPSPARRATLALGKLVLLLLPLTPLFLGWSR